MKACERIKLSRKVYKDKVFACWLGKNIGGTLGAPYECRKYVNNLEFYDPVPDGSAPNDDLDLQLVWLKMLEDKGINLALPNFADYWMQHLSAYPWNEYGFCLKNLERGLRPPISGCFENYFVDEMGSPIRSEIWACIAPAEPQLAAEMAWMDSALDHAGGEGTYGEMFWAAVESAAFVVNEPKTLIQIGLTMIPISCSISRVIREALRCWENGISWAEARECIVTTFGHHQPCNAIPNHGFTILGWLYGKDFGDKLCKAVNCGYDTDCTGATLGSVLGIIGGTRAIPTRWREPIGEKIILHKFTGKFNTPKTINELTERTMALAEKVVAAKSSLVKFASETSLPDDLLSLLFRNEKTQAALQQDIHAAVAVDGDLEITLHYGGEPVLRPGIDKILEVSLQREKKLVKAKIEVDVPPEWQVCMLPNDTCSHKRFSIFAKEVAARNIITVTINLPNQKRCAQFTILGPEEAKGFPVGANVPSCIKCFARVEACICRA